MSVWSARIQNAQPSKSRGHPAAHLHADSRPGAPDAQDITTRISFEYAFVNLVTTESALRFVAHFLGYTGWTEGAERPAGLQWSEATCARIRARARTDPASVGRPALGHYLCSPFVLKVSLLTVICVGGLERAGGGSAWPALMRATVSGGGASPG